MAAHKIGRRQQVECLLKAIGLGGERRVTGAFGFPTAVIDKIFARHTPLSRLQPQGAAIA